MNIELGISSFGETTPLETTGKAISHDQRIRDLLEEIILADKLNIDAFAIGEHHRKDFAVSAPEIILAAAASKTKQTIFQVLLQIYQQLIQLEFTNNTQQWMQLHRAGLKSWLGADHSLKLLIYLAMI